MVKRTGWRKDDPEVADEGFLGEARGLLRQYWGFCARVRELDAASPPLPFLLFMVVRHIVVAALYGAFVFLGVLVLVGAYVFLRALWLLWPFAVVAALIYGGHQYLTHDNSSLHTRGVPVVQPQAEMPGD
jgi:hypothetical protein